MARCGIFLALLAANLLGAGPALAQAPWGPTGMPYPYPPLPPSSPSAPPQTNEAVPVPRKINLEAGDPYLTAAPPVGLTDDGTPNAFNADTDYVPYRGFYAMVGPMGLTRERLGRAAIALRDQGVSIPGFPKFFDHGFVPRRDHPEIINFADLGMSMALGVRGTIGYQYETDSVELTGFWLPNKTSRQPYEDPARIDVLFFGSPAFPLGFSGNNNLWLQADKVRISLETAMGNLELNYRKATGGGAEWIFGLRYIDLHERFSIFTDDDALTLSPEDADPTLVADYTVRTHNRVVGPQLGLECEWPIRPWLMIGGLAKGMWGANFSNTHIQLIRGDNFRAPPGIRSEVQFGHAYEAHLFLDLMISDRCRLRGGYQVLWLVHVYEAHEQVDFNLTNITGRERTQGSSIFYHGPVVELHFAF